MPTAARVCKRAAFSVNALILSFGLPRIEAGWPGSLSEPTGTSLSPLTAQDSDVIVKEVASVKVAAIRTERHTLR